MVKVPLFDLTRQYEKMKDEIMEGIDRVIRNGRVILGPEVEKLEKRLAEYVGVRFGIGVSSGTDALVLSLRALGIGEGDFVITTPYTFFATASCISRNGAVPIFLDIDGRTYNLDLDQVDIFLERLKGERSALGEDETVEKILKHYPNLKYDDVKALIPVHLFGRTMDLDRLLDVKKKKNLKIVEDSAQSIGSEWRMRDGRVIRSGSVGDVSILSFFPTKNLGAYGDGGMVLTNDEKIAKRIRKLRVHGSERKYFHDEIGFNARLDEIQALVLNIKMKYLDEWIERRYNISKIYTDELSGLPGIKNLPFTEWRDGVRYHVYHQYVVEFEDQNLRNIVVEEFRKKGIGFSIYYPLPLHLQKCFSFLGYEAGDLPVAERLSQTTLALPIFPEMTDDEISYVVATIRDALKGRR